MKIVTEEEYRVSWKHTTCPYCLFDFHYNKLKPTSFPFKGSNDWWRCRKCGHRVNLTRDGDMIELGELDETGMVQTMPNGDRYAMI